MKVLYKDELDGIGPVTVIDQEAYDAWLAENVEPGSIGIPYGATPDGVTYLGWLTLAEAEAIASDYSVELEAT